MPNRSLQSGAVGRPPLISGGRLVFIFLIAILVLIKRQDTIALRFAAFSISVCGWSFPHSIWITQNYSHETTLLLIRIAHAFANLDHPQPTHSPLDAQKVLSKEGTSVMPRAPATLTLPGMQELKKEVQSKSAESNLKAARQDSVAKDSLEARENQIKAYQEAVNSEIKKLRDDSLKTRLLIAGSD